MTRPARDIIVIGGSAGAVDAVNTIVKALPSTLPAVVAIVVHHHERSANVFGQLLQRWQTLPVVTVDGQHPLQHGRIYVPTSDHHLLLEPERLVLSRAAHENRARPAIDPLFRSAAAAFGARVMGIVLTGTLDDGAAGLAAIRRRGGLTLVQDPDDAPFPEMPRNAISAVPSVRRAPLAEIPDLITAAVEGKMAPAPSENMVRNPEPPGTTGELTNLTCPTCHGALRETVDGQFVGFGCHTGHTFGVDSLRLSQDEDLELALWSAVRTMQEKIILLNRLQQRAQVGPPSYLEGRHQQERDRLEHHVSTLRRLLEER